MKSPKKNNLLDLFSSHNNVTYMYIRQSLSFYEQIKKKEKIMLTIARHVLLSMHIT